MSKEMTTPQRTRRSTQFRKTKGTEILTRPHHSSKSTPLKLHIPESILKANPLSKHSLISLSLGYIYIYIYISKEITEKERNACSQFFLSWLSSCFVFVYKYKYKYKTNQPSVDAERDGGGDGSRRRRRRRRRREEDKSWSLCDGKEGEMRLWGSLSLLFSKPETGSYENIY